MQARPPCISSLAPPSSPPSADWHSGAPKSPSEADGRVSPTWTAPSPTGTLGHSSPELPPLPAFSLLGNDSRTPATSARNDKTDSSYYTASWGSPYRHPPPSLDQQRPASTSLSSDDFGDSSPLQFGLKHLLPSPLGIEEESPSQFNLDHLIPRLQRSASPVQFTLENLIQSRLPFLETPTRSSCNSSNAPHPSCPDSTLEGWIHQSWKEYWDQSASKLLNEDDIECETDSEPANDQNSSVPSKQIKGHKSRGTNKTLNQEDFWREFGVYQRGPLGKMLASKYADPEVVSRGRHDLSSAAPLNKAAKGSSSQAEIISPSVPIPAGSPKLVKDSPVMIAQDGRLQPVHESTPDAPSTNLLVPHELRRVQPVRTRKKVMVKGKGCVISIPSDIPRGCSGYPPKPMTAEAVEAKLQQLESRGYNVRGVSAGGVEPHNRAIWPEEADLRAERAKEDFQFRIRIAKKAQWEDYVKSLMEAKLAALGVSIGGEEDIALPLSRQASSQQHQGMPFSPPLPTSSAGSHRITREGSIASSSFPFGPSPGHMSRQSVASPAAFSNPRISMHMHRHSTFAPPNTFGHRAMSPSGTWSPGGYFGSQDGRSGSPALPLSRLDLSGLVSPQSPFAMRPQQSFPITPVLKEDYLSLMQQQQHPPVQLLQQQQQQQQHQYQQQVLGMRPSSTLAEVPEDEDEDEETVLKHFASAPEIAIPTPRSHRHNISQNLEREAGNGEYHLEQAIDKQFAEGGDFSTEPDTQQQTKSAQAVVNSTWEEPRSISCQPQPHSRAHSLTNSQRLEFVFPTPLNSQIDADGTRMNLSENVNPSLEDGELFACAQSSTQHSQMPSQTNLSWSDNKLQFGKPSSAAHSKHNSRSSLSMLNGEAKEFKFNSAALFSPGTSASILDLPSPIDPSADVSAAYSNKPSVDIMSSFNASAPLFVPEAPALKPDAPAFNPMAEASIFKPVIDTPEFSPSGTGDSEPLLSGMTISSMISFKPDATVFNPGVPAFTPTQAALVSTSFSSKIFGDVNISATDIVKPASRSKAVPIVRPDVSRQKTPDKKETWKEEKEEEDERLTPADRREKRVRCAQEDANDVPRFALQPVLASQSLSDVELSQMLGQDLKAGCEDIPHDEEKISLYGSMVESDSKSSESQPLQHNAHMVERIPQPESPHNISVDESTSNGSDLLTPTMEDPAPLTRQHACNNTLSANAKSFDFPPHFRDHVPDFGFHVTRPSQSENDKSQPAPSRFRSRSPASTCRPSDDGSYKTALDSRRHITSYPESENAGLENLGGASFNDIDAVMKQMDAGGSDFGVERDDKYSSPQTTSDQLAHNDLQPNLNLRSDAPSPSPQRFRVLGNIPGPDMSGKDLFDGNRAAIAFESPVRRLNNTEEVPVSDWDDGLVSEEEDRVQMRSRFFDTHVDELMGRLLQSRLSPLEQNLRGIQESLAMILQRRGWGGHRSMSVTGLLDSDADDEDDDIDNGCHYRNRSSRKDKELQKIRSIIQEVLAVHQSQVASIPALAAESVLPEQIREIFSDVLAAHKPLSASNEHVPIDSVRAVVEEAIAAPSIASRPAAETIKIGDIRSAVAEALASYQPQPQPHSPPASQSVQPDMVRFIIAETIASHKPTTLETPANILQPQIDMTEIMQVLSSIKASIVQSSDHHLKADDVCELIDNALRRQTKETAERAEAKDILERNACIEDLKKELEETSARLDAGREASKLFQTREMESARILRVTEEELGLLQQVTAEDEAKARLLTQERDALRIDLDTKMMEVGSLRESFSSLQNENEELKLKNAGLESSKEMLQKKLEDVIAENEVVSLSLEEHRLSANKWRSGIQEAHEESEKLRKAVDQARYQAEEAIRVRETMRAKLEKLQEDMITASQQVAAERAERQRNEERSLTRYEVLSARTEAEGRTRQRLERELERLETQEREGMKLRFHLEHAQKHNAGLERTIEQLRHESVEYQKNVERYECDIRNARDAAHVEIRRIRMLMEADVDTANNQVNVVRHELESEIARTRAELDQLRLDADTAKEKHELNLEAVSEIKEQAVHEANENKMRGLQDQQHTFERQIEQIKHDHAYALKLAHQDKKRADAFYDEKLSFADSKLDHFKDKIALLEEKLQVAKQAASAAAAAASKPSNAVPSQSSGSPEKISAQALRESIAVLQEQLQEREARIETLEHDLDEFDTQAPVKLKERDTEINWLRELLGVRVDDLNDLIRSLAQPNFDREAVRDAAIRIRANLLMEQSEKERLTSSGQPSFTPLSTLSNFASPKAVQIAAAIGNWRKGRGGAISTAGSLAANTRNQTPSRPGQISSQSFLSGLMTPPSPNLRRTSSKHSQDLRPSSITSCEATEAGMSVADQQVSVPRTPPLMRMTSYDKDAEIELFSESGFYDEEGTVDGERTPLTLAFRRDIK